MTIEEPATVLAHAFAADLARIAASDCDTYEILAAKTYAKLDQLSDLASRFPGAESRKLKRNLKALAASVAAVVDNPPKGQSARVALKRHVAAMAAAFAKVQP